MRAIDRSSQFKRDYKRESKGRYGRTLDGDLESIVRRLVLDQPLESQRRDHQLTGKWRNHRDCHVHPDLVLIYRKPDDETPQLVRLASHSELGW